MEERISKLEDKTVEFTSSETKKKNKNSEVKDTKLRDTIKWTSDMNYKGERTRGRARGRKLIQRNNIQQNCHSELKETLNFPDKQMFITIRLV